MHRKLKAKYVWPTDFFFFFYTIEITSTKACPDSPTFLFSPQLLLLFQLTVQMTALTHFKSSISTFSLVRLFPQTVNDLV